jgi:hypothetical protein
MVVNGLLALLVETTLHFAFPNDYDWHPQYARKRREIHWGVPVSELSTKPPDRLAAVVLYIHTNKGNHPNATPISQHVS